MSTVSMPSTRMSEQWSLQTGTASSLGTRVPKCGEKGSLIDSPRLSSMAVVSSEWLDSLLPSIALELSFRGSLVTVRFFDGSVGYYRWEGGNVG